MADVRSLRDKSYQAVDATNLPQRSVSCFKQAAVSTGDVSTAVTEKSCNRSATSDSARISATACESLPTISGGVRGGTTMGNQPFECPGLTAIGPGCLVASAAHKLRWKFYLPKQA